ncbi:MAG: hypothetical protein AAGG72_10435 [Pseudomonadota bacterium]
MTKLANYGLTYALFFATVFVIGSMLARSDNCTFRGGIPVSHSGDMLCHGLGYLGTGQFGVSK